MSNHGAMILPWTAAQSFPMHASACLAPVILRLLTQCHAMHMHVDNNYPLTQNHGGPKAHPKSRNTKKQSFKTKLFPEVRANFCLLPYIMSQEPS